LIGKKKKDYTVYLRPAEREPALEREPLELLPEPKEPLDERLDEPLDERLYEPLDERL
jgi:hypothetical protein